MPLFAGTAYECCCVSINTVNLDLRSHTNPAMRPPQSGPERINQTRRLWVLIGDCLGEETFDDACVAVRQKHSDADAHPVFYALGWPVSSRSPSTTHGRAFRATGLVSELFCSDEHGFSFVTVEL